MSSDCLLLLSMQSGRSLRGRSVQREHQGKHPSELRGCFRFRDVAWVPVSDVQDVVSRIGQFEALEA